MAFLSARQSHPQAGTGLLPLGRPRGPAGLAPSPQGQGDRPTQSSYLSLWRPHPGTRPSGAPHPSLTLAGRNYGSLPLALPPEKGQQHQRCVHTLRQRLTGAVMGERWARHRYASWGVYTHVLEVLCSVCVWGGRGDSWCEGKGRWPRGWGQGTVITRLPCSEKDSEFSVPS